MYDRLYDHWNRKMEYEALVCRRRAYEAENTLRERSGSPPAYGYDHFMELAEQFRALQYKPTEHAHEED